MNNSLLTTDHSQAYSYGDSAGITPDFPFNPILLGTNYATNVAVGKMNYKNKLLTEACTMLDLPAGR